MNKALISLMFVLLFFVGSCGGEEEDNSCMNENEERTVPCATDNTKEQKQICRQGEWIDKGFCYFCEEYSTQTITCATDDTKEQKQRCSHGDWVDEGGCTCPENNKFCHEHEGLNWSDASSDYMAWDDAVTYCENLGGRLPTISELRTLIQNCQATETGGECGVTDDCLSWDDCWNDACDGCGYDGSSKYSVFGDIYWFWSSSEQSDDANYAWGVKFSYGDVSFSNKVLNVSVRCVR